MARITDQELREAVVRKLAQGASPLAIVDLVGNFVLAEFASKGNGIIPRFVAEQIPPGERARFLAELETLTAPFRQ